MVCDFNNKFQDKIQTDVDAKTDVRQSLDDISKEVNEIKAELTHNNNDNADGINDGDNGNSQRAALGEIQKIKKIAEILETIVLPPIVDSVQKSAQNKGASGSIASPDPIKIIPKGLKLLQHHAIASGVDDGQSTINQKLNPQSDDK